MKNTEKCMTKQKLLQSISKNTGLSKKNVDLILNELSNTIKTQLKKSGPEKFILPGLLKLTIKNVPEQKERFVFNPLAKKETLFKAKPAMRKIKVKILKKLKDAIN